MSHNKKEIFSKETKKVDEILHKGINNTVKNKSILFNLRERTLKCMDERTPGGVHLAGSGILLGIDKTIEVIKQAKIKKITWHKECGAVGLFLKKQGKQPSLEEIDARAKSFSEKLAEMVGVEVEEEVMQGETTFHAARAIYYDNTGEFNVGDELPAGFVISRKFLDKAYAQEELKIAVSIAFGRHGFEELFSVEQPLLVVAVSSIEEIDRILLEIEGALLDVDEYKEGRIKIDQILT